MLGIYNTHTTRAFSAYILRVRVKSWKFHSKVVYGYSSGYGGMRRPWGHGKWWVHEGITDNDKHSEES